MDVEMHPVLRDFALLQSDGLGERGYLQVVPFQCKSKVLGLRVDKVPVCPTVQAFRVEVTATLYRVAPPCGVGLGTRVHAVPFQRRISVFWPRSAQPTAHALDADVAATPARSAPPCGVGLGTRVHAVPFQRRISVFWPRWAQPTAHALRAEVTATLYRVAPPAGVGLGTCVQEVPFQRRISVLVLVPVALPVSPTAHPLCAEVTVTPYRLPPDAGVGLDTRFHALPSHRAISVLGLALNAGPACPTAHAFRAEVAATASRNPLAERDTARIPGRVQAAARAAGAIHAAA